MPLTQSTLEDKPYNICISCDHIGRSCDGPNFLAMTSERWYEWVRLRKEYLGWTNAKIAELSGIAKSSIDRILSGTSKDIRVTTMQAITKALVNGTWGQYPCAMAADTETITDDSAELINKCEHLRKEIETKDLRIDDLKKRIEMNDRLMQERYDFLKRKDRVIRALSVTCGIMFLLFLTTLIIDILNQDIGFIWMN